MGRGAGELADFYRDPDNLGIAIAHGVTPPWNNFDRLYTIY